MILIMKSKSLTFVFLAMWCVLVLIYFALWRNQWFLLISTNALLLVKLFLGLPARLGGFGKRSITP